MPDSNQDAIELAGQELSRPDQEDDTAEELYHFRISDVETHVRKPSRLKVKVRKILKLTTKMTFADFELTAKEIYNYCLKQIKDSHELHTKRSKAVDMIKDVIERADVAYIDTVHVVHLTWSIMSCIHHFQLRFRTGTNALITWTRRRKAQECMEVYGRLIKKLPKAMHRIILNSMIVFYKEGKLWTIEFALTDLICDLLYRYEDVEEALEDMITSAEEASLTSHLDTQMLIKVLYETLAKIRWSHISETMLKRFLVMLRKSVIADPGELYHYASMRRGLNICLRNITRNLNNKDLMLLLTIIIKKIAMSEIMENEILLELGNIGEYAASRYVTHSFQVCFPDELLINLLTLISAENIYHNLFGSRVLQNLMDRHHNLFEFENVRIYYKNVSYDINVSRFNVHDKIYFKRYRGAIHNALMVSLANHYTHKVNLENMYSTLAVICVEVPCAYTAASIVCIAMAMQEFVLDRVTGGSDMIANHHVHAIVMALMSLVCYVHKAGVFYDYVTKIMERRSELAPHLNPPIKGSYAYAQHHVLWNKPALFFEDWEVRYGLWKCFRASDIK